MTITYWKRRTIVGMAWHHALLRLDGTSVPSNGQYVGRFRCVGWTVHFPKSEKRLTFTGTAALLVEQVGKGECPTGILLDRLEECPEEGGGPVSLILAAVAHYRQSHPIN